jgi:hypothetical protein
MQKFRILLLLWLCCTFSVQAQHVFVSSPSRFNFQSDDFDLIGRIGDKIFTYTNTSEGYLLNAYNDSMELRAIVALDFFPKKISAAQFFIIDQRIIVFYRAEEKGNILQYAAIMDENARLTQKPIVIDSSKKAWIGDNSNLVVIELSGDKSRFGILKFKNNSVIKNIEMQVLDNNLQRLNKKRYTVQNDQDLSARQVEVNGSGAVYLLLESKNRYAGKESNLQLWVMDGNNSIVQKKQIPLEGRFASGAHIKLDKTSNICYLGSFYAAKKTGSIEGAIYAMYQDNAAEPMVFRDIPFSIELRKEATGTVKKKTFDNFNVNDIIVKNDGGILLISEHNTIITRSNYTSPNFGFYSPFYYSTMPDASAVEYHYGDIMVLNYDANGAMVWSKFIRKEQVSQNDGGSFSSYGLLNSGGSLVFIFNDYLKYNSGIQLAALDIDGQVQMQRLDMENTRLNLLPRMAIQTGNREMLIPYFNKSNVGVVRLVF